MSQAFACLQERLEVVEGLGWGRFGISVHAQIELALVMSTLPLPLIFLSFTCKYICSFLTEVDCLCLCYKTILYFIFEQKSRAKCAKMSRWDWEGAWGDRKCGLIAVILTHNDCHSCPDRSPPGLVATKRTR